MSFKNNKELTERCFPVGRILKHHNSSDDAEYYEFATVQHIYDDGELAVLTQNGQFEILGDTKLYYTEIISDRALNFINELHKLTNKINQFKDIQWLLLILYSENIRESLYDEDLYSYAKYIENGGNVFEANRLADEFEFDN